MFSRFNIKNNNISDIIFLFIFIIVFFVNSAFYFDTDKRIFFIGCFFSLFGALYFVMTIIETKRINDMKNKMKVIKLGIDMNNSNLYEIMQEFAKKVDSEYWLQKNSNYELIENDLYVLINENINSINYSVSVLNVINNFKYIENEICYKLSLNNENELTLTWKN